MSERATLTAQALTVALKAHQAGELAAAETIYRRLVELDADNTELILPLTICLHDRGQHAEAVALLQKAIERAPADPRLYVAQGRSLKALGRLDEAVTRYRSALTIDPSSVDTLISLGIALRRAGRTGEAIDTLERAASVSPQRAEAWINLGTARYQAHQYRSAVDALQKAVDLAPGLAEAHCNLGRACLGLAEYDRAEQSLRRAVALRPGYAEGWMHLAMVHEARGDLAQATRDYASAIRTDPDNLDAYRSLGSVLYNRGELQPALECFAAMCERHPEHPAGPLWKGLVLREQGRMEEALASFDRTIALAPAATDGYSHKGFTLWLMGQYAAAMSAVEAALQRNPRDAPTLNLQGNLALLAGRVEDASEAYRKALEADPSHDDARGNALFMLCYDERVSAQELQEAHRTWGEWRLASAAGIRPSPKPAAYPRRIGFVSADFNQHSVAYFVEPILERLALHGFEVFCYYNGRRVDPITRRLGQCPVQWRHVTGVSDEAAANQIRDDAIDILVDLGGHTGGNRLGIFALNPAPVQVTYLGYPTTVGLPTIGYRITDWVVDPYAEERSCERPLRMPISYFCFRPAADAPEVAPRSDTSAFTFGSFNNLGKVSGHTLRLWASVLHVVPGSILLLKNKSLSDAQLRHEIEQRFRALGVAPERLALRAWEHSTRSHLSTYAEVDVALDTFPYNGATTTCEALWMGVPVVTLAGATHASRMGASILTAARQEAWIARGDTAFVERCIELARDRTALAAKRGAARSLLSRSALLDEERFVAAFADTLRDAWRTQLEPAGIF
jgi:protein O-GlcNAc transferase